MRERTHHLKVYCVAYAVSDITENCCVGMDIVLRIICMFYRVIVAQNSHETDCSRDDFGGIVWYVLFAVL